MTMTTDIHALAHHLQAEILRSVERDPANWSSQVARVQLDAWATLARWHEHGERVWRISAAAADETADMLLPPDLSLATARTRGEAVAYQLPDRPEWIILARHAPAPCVVPVAEGVSWAWGQPLLTYCTLLDGGPMAAGYYSLTDQPTPARLSLRPGNTLGQTLRALTEASIAEEEYRVGLALLHHYLP